MEAKPQYTLEDLRSWKGSNKRRLAVIGDPVAHSLSPEMMNPALEAAGIDCEYIRLHLKEDEFEEALKLLPEAGFLGSNVTIPHKLAALQGVDEVDEAAHTLGAVNTIVVEGQKLLGFNSDGPGIVRAIREEFQVDVRDLRIMLLGAGGGAGRAVAVQFAMERCERLVMVNRTVEKAQTLVDELRGYFEDDRVQGPEERLLALPLIPDQLAHALDNVDLIVNASSLGMKRTDPEIISEAFLQPHHLVYDMIYTSRTKLLHSAANAGARTADGLGMLLHQGAISFEWWFDQDAPIKVMRDALKEAFSKK